MASLLNKSPKELKQTCIFYILILIFCFFLPTTLGYSFRWSNIELSIGSFVLFVFLRRLNYWFFFLCFLFTLITGVVFLPQAVWYGQLTAPMITAFFETDWRESKEFVQSFPTYLYIYSLLYFLLGIVILYLAKKINKCYIVEKNKKVITTLLAILLLSITIYNPVKKVIVDGENFTWSSLSNPLYGFYASILENVYHYKILRKEIEQGIYEKSTWQISNIKPKYKNYVIVVGESVRRDYMSLYGFPLENSLFLKSVPGTVIEGYTSAAAHTTFSLTRTFIQRKQDSLLYANNIINLAKEAGFKTIWISNQGYSGVADSQVSLLASVCDERRFTKRGSYNSINIFDSVLLPIFRSELSHKYEGSRLFIIHLLGSHQVFAERLENPIHFDFINKDLSAYIQTIEQTDKFLENIYDILKENEESFSMLYFSDHGLTSRHRDDYSISTLVATGNENRKQSAFRVPFVVISSDDTEHRHLKVNKSAYKFVDGFANWLGIEERSLLSSYNFLSIIPDSLIVYNGEDILLDTLEDDPILLPR